MDMAKLVSGSQKVPQLFQVTPLDEVCVLLSCIVYQLFNNDLFCKRLLMFDLSFMLQWTDRSQNKIKMAKAKFHRNTFIWEMKHVGG
jgi:hypothetical protein